MFEEVTYIPSYSELGLLSLVCESEAQVLPLNKIGKGDELLQCIAAAKGIILLLPFLK